MVSGQLLGGELQGGTGRECGWMDGVVRSVRLFTGEQARES